MKKSIVWPIENDIEDEKNTFAKLLNIEEIFLLIKAPTELEALPTIKSSPEIMRRPQSTEDPNEKIEANPNDKYEELDPFNMSETEEALKGQLSNIDRVAPPSFKVDP